MADIKRATEDFVNVIKNTDVYKHYFSSYTTDGKPYKFKSFRSDIKEARNQGLRITSEQAHAMKMLAKYEKEWFDEEGNLNEGLSRNKAEKARLYRSIV